MKFFHDFALYKNSTYNNILNEDMDEQQNGARKTKEFNVFE